MGGREGERRLLQQSHFVRHSGLCPVRLIKVVTTNNQSVVTTNNQSEGCADLASTTRAPANDKSTATCYNRGREKRLSVLSSIATENATNDLTLSISCPSTSPASSEILPAIVVFVRLMSAKACRFSGHNFCRLQHAGLHKVAI